MVTQETVKALVEVLRLKSELLYRHSLEVAYIAERLSEFLQYEDTGAIKVAGLLHDLGKIAVKDSILQKPGDLSRREWEQIRIHPVMSVDLLSKINHCNPLIIKAVLYHHESADGSGYFGLKVLDIPLEAKILRVSDVFSAMTMDRPYKVAYPYSTSAAYCSGLFDLGVDRSAVRSVLLDCKRTFEKEA